MISRWWFYCRLGWLDLVRLWSTTQHHVIIVAGICLPILMLLGLKRGHVAELRRELVTSPSGREVTFWSSQKGELMNREAVTRLESELPAVQVIIPEKQRVVRMRRQNSQMVDLEVEAATLFSTRRDDPKLSQLGLTAPEAGARELILGQALAKKLQADTGDTVQAVITRGRGAEEESVVLDCVVSSVMPTETQDAMIGYADIDLLDAFEQYIRGSRVESLGWSSARTPARDGYTSYLLFCETQSNLTEDDRRQLKERGFQIEDRSQRPPVPLAQLLDESKRGQLVIYELSTSSSLTNPRSRLYLAPSELSESTTADDVAVPWNPALQAEVGGQAWQLVGLSMPRRTWLREYFRKSEIPFDYEAQPYLTRVTSGKGSSPKILKWPLSPQQHLELTLDAVSDVPSQTAAETTSDPSIGNAEPGAEQTAANEGPASSQAANGKSDVEPQQAGRLKQTVVEEPTHRIAVVPANLSAWLTAYVDRQVEFDSSIKLFVPQPEAAVYDRARLYAATIDNVPEVVVALAERKFAVMSETGRISEIHRQDSSLQLLVVVVGAGVFLFGVVTVVSVLLDSTDRKRGTIGILRVMGMSRGGIFASILMRAGAIGILAAGLSVGCGWLLAQGLQWHAPPHTWWLQWKPVLRVELTPWDWSLVAAGALVCCGFGALLPAWRASRLDPFDAIIEGRFR